MVWSANAVGLEDASPTNVYPSSAPSDRAPAHWPPGMAANPLALI